LSAYRESLWRALPEGLDPPDLDVRLAFLLERARALQAAGRAPVRVLDVGCGEGQFAAELERAGF
jgi:2-polyprenyl-3-methyl-5-hydroxy-6-metoxy-1,4-benzoquinol methylase